jgi:hypothetical protein
MDDGQMTIRVEARMIGKRKTPGAPWYVALPPAFVQEARENERPPLLGDLIAHIVRAEVGAFRERQEERRLLRFLSPQEINDGASKGKIAPPGETEIPAVAINEQDAIDVALQAFTDGIYLVFLDGQAQRNLTDPIQLNAASSLLFIRLVALVGG